MPTHDQRFPQALAGADQVEAAAILRPIVMQRAARTISKARSGRDQQETPKTPNARRGAAADRSNQPPRWTAMPAANISTYWGKSPGCMLRTETVSGTKMRGPGTVASAMPAMKARIVRLSVRFRADPCSAAGMRPRASTRRRAEKASEGRAEPHRSGLRKTIRHHEDARAIGGRSRRCPMSSTGNTGSAGRSAACKEASAGPA